jgi:hypothetical protein
VSTKNSPGKGLEAIEKASKDELRAVQLERMKWSIKHAYDNVPHYRKKYDAAGVHPGDLKQLSDLAKFPFTTKADLRDTYPFGMFATPMRDVVRIHASSGTTGKPTVVGYTKNDIAMWAQLMARSMRAAGGSADDIILNSYGYGLFTGGLGAHYGGEALGATVIPMSGGQTEKQIQLIQDFKPTMICCTPSYVLTIADEMIKLGINPRETSLRVGLFGAEPWTNEMRREIEERLNIDAVDIYGLSEVMGPGVACECAETKDGPTIWEDHFYPEIIHPETGAGAGRRRDGRTGIHLAVQGGAAHHPLSHPRPDAPAAGYGAHHAAHGKDHRSQRRHADHPRRERVPDADRGDPAQASEAVRPVPTAGHSRRPSGQTRCLCRGARRPVGQDHRTTAQGDRRRGRAPHQGAGRGFLDGACGRDGQGGADTGRQGPAGDRQAAEINLLEIKQFTERLV